LIVLLIIFAIYLSLRFIIDIVLTLLHNDTILLWFKSLPYLILNCFLYFFLSLIDKFIHLFLQLCLIDISIVALHRKILFLDYLHSLFLFYVIVSLVEGVWVIIGKYCFHFHIFNVFISM
jgi:hypothetical protein